MPRLRDLAFYIAVGTTGLIVVHDYRQVANAQTIQAPGHVPPGLSGLVPTGTLTAFAGSTAPDGFQICDGRALSRTTYARLFAVIGTTYGAGDGSTTFNVPDFRGRAAFGSDAMGGSAAGRLSEMDAVGKTGGAEQQTLSVDQMPAHAHAIADPGHSHAASVSGGSYTVTEIVGNFLNIGPDFGITGWGWGEAVVNHPNVVHASGQTVNINPSYSGITGTNAAGGGQPVSVLPPSIAVTYLIKD